MELPSNTIKLEAKDFTLDMYAKVYESDPIINNVLLTVKLDVSLCWRYGRSPFEQHNKRT